MWQCSFCHSRWQKCAFIAVVAVGCIKRKIKALNMMWLLSLSHQRIANDAHAKMRTTQLQRALQSQWPRRLINVLLIIKYVTTENCKKKLYIYTYIYAKPQKLRPENDT